MHRLDNSSSGRGLGSAASTPQLHITSARQQHENASHEQGLAWALHRTHLSHDQQQTFHFFSPCGVVNPRGGATRGMSEWGLRPSCKSFTHSSWPTRKFAFPETQPGCGFPPDRILTEHNTCRLSWRGANLDADALAWFLCSQNPVVPWFLRHWGCEVTQPFFIVISRRGKGLSAACGYCIGKTMGGRRNRWEHRGDVWQILRGRKRVLRIISESYRRYKLIS